MKLQQLTQSRLEDSNAVITLVCIAVAYGSTWGVGSCTLASRFTALFAATVDSKVIVDAAVMTAVSSIITSGMQQYNNFVEERLEKGTKSIKNPP